MLLFLLIENEQHEREQNSKGHSYVYLTAIGLYLIEFHSKEREGFRFGFMTLIPCHAIPSRILLWFIGKKLNDYGNRLFVIGKLLVNHIKGFNYAWNSRKYEIKKGFRCCWFIVIGFSEIMEFGWFIVRLLWLFRCWVSLSFVWWFEDGESCQGVRVGVLPGSLSYFHS